MSSIFLCALKGNATYENGKYLFTRTTLRDSVKSYLLLGVKPRSFPPVILDRLQEHYRESPGWKEHYNPSLHRPSAKEWSGGKGTLLK